MKLVPNCFKNIWFRLIIIPISLYFSTTWYYGWQYVYRLLINDGAFSWRCESCNSDHPGYDDETGICRPVDGDLYVCTTQDNAVQAIYTVMSSCEFIGGVIAGILYDLVGYKISLIIGYALHLFGIFSVCQSSRSTQLYYAGAVCAGLSVNIVAFPAYYIKLFFPKYGGAVLMINFAAQTAGSSVMMIIYQIVQNGKYSFADCQAIYSCIGIPLVIMYFLSIPRNRETCINELKASGYEVDKYKQKERTSLKHAGKAFLYFDTSAFSFLWYLPFVMANNAFITCVAPLAGDYVSFLLGQVQVFQFLLTFAFGMLLVGGAYSVFIKWFPFFFQMIGSLIGLSSLIFFVSNETWQQAAAVIWLISNSFIYSSKYVYAEMVIDDAVYGMFTGTIGGVTGVVQFTNMIWRSIAKDNLDDFILAYFIIIIFSSTLGCYLFYRVEAGKTLFLRYIVSQKSPTQSQDSTGEVAESIARISKLADQK